jgi:hypothetical protein
MQIIIVTSVTIWFAISFGLIIKITLFFKERDSFNILV